MNEITFEQARYFREGAATPWLAGRSPGFREDWLQLAQKLVVGFGTPPPSQVLGSSSFDAGVPAEHGTLAVFAQPLGPDHVAVVQVAQRVNGRETARNGSAPVFGFHLLVAEKAHYRRYFGDPFWLAQKFPADWSQAGGFQTLASSAEAMQPRTVADVQKVLRRIKAGALKEDEDPLASDFVHSMENSASPALLGGAQVLVEGGKLVFERPGPDNELLQGLWTLLPNSTRARLWPASFAFANTLGFDAVVVPRLQRGEFEGYTSEEQAADYPQGHYELSLQIAAEAGNQRDLDQLLNRRSTGETMRLAWTLLIVVTFLALTPTILEWVFPKPELTTAQKAAAAAGMVGVRDPWTATAFKLCGDRLFYRE